MDLRKIIFTFLLWIPFLVRGQEYRVESFENVPSDLTARTESRVDNNGRKCGLIKVYVKDAITATSGPIIGEVVDRGMEKWVYVAHDAKKIQLLFKEHMPLYVTFDDFNYPTITGQMTYILKLKEDEEAQASISNQGHPSGDTNGLVVSQQQNQENIVLTAEEMFEKGKAAYDRKDYEEAVKWYRMAAEQGDAKAQNSLGCMYIFAEGVTQDYNEAVNWIRKSAEQGNIEAQVNLGVFYYQGRVVSQDYSESAKWCLKAALQGSYTAQTLLGNMYYSGNGVRQDHRDAKKWYEMAAYQGSAWAQYYLGKMYEEGVGVVKDMSEARKWYEMAAAQGIQEAIDNLNKSEKTIVTIIDSKGKEPLIGCIVTIGRDGRRIFSSCTDFDGKCEIKDIRKGDLIKFEYVGFKTKEVIIYSEKIPASITFYLSRGSNKKTEYEIL